MFERDLFVAAVAIALGGLMVWGGAVDHPTLFRMWLPGYFDRKFGRTRARTILVLLGAGAIGLGGFLIYQGQRHRNPNALAPSSTIDHVRQVVCREIGSVAFPAAVAVRNGRNAWRIPK